MIVDMIEKGGLEFALKLWAARNLGAVPYMVRKGDIYIPDDWEMQSCCIGMIERGETKHLSTHCCSAAHIAVLCHIDLIDLEKAIVRLRKEKR